MKTAIVARGWIKVRNFRNSNNKAAYLYILTRKGIEEKVNVTADFLRRKVAEYDLLSKEIERLTEELTARGAPSFSIRNDTGDSLDNS